MRFLCLHGSCTNSEIFEIQTGGIRQQLEKNGHRFTFMNGKQPAQVEAELEGVVDGPFYNHYPRGDNPPGSAIQEAYEHTMAFITEQGPFDAVMGFSQGAALAASLIINHRKKNPTSAPLFRAAVFICGVKPWDGAGMERILPQPDTYPIQIPTANIVGKLDSVYKESVQLFELCEPAQAAFFDHGSKHMVPFDLRNTEEMVRVIEETVKKAMRG